MCIRDSSIIHVIYYFFSNFWLKKIFPTIVLFQIIACSNEGLFFEDAYVIENVGVIDPIDGLELNMSVVIKENKILSSRNF